MECAAPSEQMEIGGKVFVAGQDILWLRPDNRWVKRTVTGFRYNVKYGLLAVIDNHFCFGAADVERDRIRED